MGVQLDQVGSLEGAVKALDTGPVLAHHIGVLHPPHALDVAVVLAPDHYVD